MGFVESVRSLLPASSRSFHGMYERVNEISWRMRNASDAIVRMEQRMNAHDTHSKLFAWYLLRCEGEDLEDTKRRFFLDIPRAHGGLRYLQLCTARLLDEFDTLCRREGIDYWMDFGTLLGAERHQGFIPWDDDVDLRMMRIDLERLQRVVADQARYRISIVYDRYAFCRQIRFQYADESVPCFLDLFPLEYSLQSGRAPFDSMRIDRACLKEAVANDSDLRVWNGSRGYIADTEPEAALIEAYFGGALDAEYSVDGRLTRESSKARSVVWGIDNIEPVRCEWCYPLETVFPLKRMVFEGTECFAPNDMRTILEAEYGDIFELPNDIASHFAHIAKDLYQGRIIDWEIPE